MNSDCRGGFWRLDGCAPSRYSMKIHSNSPTLKMKSAYVNCMEHHCKKNIEWPRIFKVRNPPLRKSANKEPRTAMSSRLEIVLDCASVSIHPHGRVEG